MNNPKHKFRIGTKVYKKGKPHSQGKGTVKSLSIGWNPPMAYVKFSGQSYWIDENNLIPADFNPSVRNNEDT